MKQIEDLTEQLYNIVYYRMLQNFDFDFFNTTEQMEFKLVDIIGNLRRELS